MAGAVRQSLRFVMGVRAWACKAGIGSIQGCFMLHSLVAGWQGKLALQVEQ
jgi:hypothetical protein